MLLVSALGDYLHPFPAVISLSLQRSECLLSSHAFEVCFDMRESVLSP